MLCLRLDKSAAMYTQFFRLRQAPFSISPDPRYLFMSERHREALAHLLYGVNTGGGLVLLTGDIGTGKTTICRCFLEQVPANCNVAYIFNPKLTVNELLQSVCEEFHLAPVAVSVKDYIDTLNRYLLASHAEGRNNVLVIDEAQNLSAEVLEQLRLLTNLETSERKLLQIILIGQPELREMLSRPDLEQLAQRVIAHYHLSALSEQETASYIQHRLATGGLAGASPFQPAVMKQIHRLSAGVPRRINLLCDRALLGAYAKNTPLVDRAIVEHAAAELFINRRAPAPRRRWHYATLGLLAGAMAIGTTAWTMNAGRLKEALPVSWFRPSPQPQAATPPAAPPPQVVLQKPEEHPSPAPAETRPRIQGELHDENAAIRELAALWGIAVQGEDSCVALTKSGVRCYRSDGGFAELKQLGRPAVLKLQDNGNKPWYALVTRISDTDLTLGAGAASQTISRLMLSRHFGGEFVTLWRAPPGFDRNVQSGDQGPEVDWLAVQLAKLNGVNPPPSGQPFGPRLQRQVREFQMAQGLFVDGIVGPVTAMHINRAAGMDEPRLARQERPASGE
jgi:general secretion pathway protein A